MKGLKKLLLLFLGLMVAFFLFLIWYQYQYAMDVVSPYAVNSPNFEKKLLIATQGSDFKDRVTNGIVDHFKSDTVYIQVIDIESLQLVDPKDYDAITIVHTWENWKPPKVVASFIEKYSEDKNKIVVFTTSGGGTYKMEGVDAIVGESILADASLFVENIINRLNELLMSNDD